MNLAWIAALFSPYEIAPHPNFSRKNPDVSPEQLMATLVIGDASWRHRPHGETDPIENDEWLNAMALSLVFDTQRTGVDKLILLLDEHRKADLARSTAYTLVACVSAAELDDYEVCERILTSMIDAVTPDMPESPLLLAVLKQQRCLRRRDSGREYLSDAASVESLLDKVDAHKLPTFPLNASTSLASADVLDSIKVALHQACWSNIPSSIYDDESVGASKFPSWQQRLRAPRSEIILTVSRDVSAQYSRWFTNELEEVYVKDGVTFGDTQPDLFHPTFRYELLGHNSVYQARRQIATFRLLNANKNPNYNHYADCIRLLRHAGADNELSMLLKQLVQGGPTSSLVSDCRSIVKNRMDVNLLRTAEMKVLAAGAQFLAPDEAYTALQGVLTAIRSPDLEQTPGRWQLDVKRSEEAWLAAAALANTAGVPGVVSEELKKTVEDASQDDLWDSMVARVLRQLEWSKVPMDSANSWSKDIKTVLKVDSSTSLAIDEVIGSDDLLHDSPGDNLSSLTNWLNWHLRNGQRLSAEHLSQAKLICLGEISAKRKQATRGEYRIGSLDVGDITAVLYSQTDDVEILDALLQFLFDTKVSRGDRSAAFDRLVRSRKPLPEVDQLKFRPRVADLLTATDDYFFDRDRTTPYPAALRFAFYSGMVDENEAFDQVSQLATSRVSAIRTEAANCIAAFAFCSQTPWIVAIAQQLSFDANSRTQAYAAKALVLSMIGSEGSMTLGSARLFDLLRSDGVTVPLAILGELRGDLLRDERMRIAVEDVRQLNPSRRVREAAADVLSL